MTEGALLRDMLARRRAALPPGTDAFRWLDGEVPGVSVDVFRDVAVLSLYREFSAPQERALAEGLMQAAPLRAVYLKRRPREARREANEAADRVAPKLPVCGAAAVPFVAHELGVAFEIRPDNGLSVGLYLDAREARGWVRRNAAGRTVLNLFAYTCGFGVAARLGGALRAVNVDSSRKVLEWGELNLAHNGLTPDRRDFIAGDSFDWLARFAKKGERFELVVLDPPGFATTKVSRFSAARDYFRLVEAAAVVLQQGGVLLALCNVDALSARDLEAQVARGLGSRRFTVTERFGASPIDFQQPSALKCLAVTVS